MKDISRLYLSALEQVKKDLKKEEEQSKSDNKEVSDEHPNKRKQFKFVVKNLKLLKIISSTTKRLVTYSRLTKVDKRRYLQVQRVLMSIPTAPF
jgi:hypothetical protein